MLNAVVLVDLGLNEIGQLEGCCEGFVLEVVVGLGELAARVRLLSLIVFVIKRFQIVLGLINQLEGHVGAAAERIRSLADQVKIVEVEIAFKRFESVREG